MQLPLLFKINSKHLIEIMLSSAELAVYLTKYQVESVADLTDAQILEISVDAEVYPTSVQLDTEQYSRNAERSAVYELGILEIVNCKAKPSFTWSVIKAEYVQRLMNELSFDYDFKDSNGNVIPRVANPISVTYCDFVGMRTINAYLGQTISGELIHMSNGDIYWSNFRIGFPER